MPVHTTWPDARLAGRDHQRRNDVACAIFRARDRSSPALMLDVSFQGYKDSPLYASFLSVTFLLDKNNRRWRDQGSNVSRKKQKNTESRVRASRKPSRRKRSSPAECQVTTKMSAANAKTQ
eukprot:4567705-Pleurochrysis_carterae.AAC.3